VTDVSDATLRLLINGEPREIPAHSTVRGLVEALDLDRRRIAVAVNRDVVPRSRYDRHALTAGDRVEIIEAVGGG
jgi:sulfur carrier protein